MADEAADDTIASALAAAYAEHEAAAVEAAKPEPVAETKPAAEVADLPAEGERPRGPDGKFLPEETRAEPTREPAEAAAKPTEGEEAEAKPSDAREPPTNWKAADKETFKALPAPAQDFLLRRHKEMEADYTKKQQASAAFRKDYEPVDTMLAPYKDAMKAKGFTPHTLIQAWANVETELAAGGQRTVSIIKQIVDGYNPDKAELAKALGLVGAPAQAAVVGEAPPAAQNGAGEHIQLPPQLLAELEQLRQMAGVVPQLKQRLDGYDQQATAAREAARVAAEAAVMNRIEEFKSANDGKGNLLNPHFDEVEADMTALAQAAIAAKQPVPPLKELYERAVWSNPSTREKLRTAETQAAEKKRQDEARAKAAAARKASSSVTGAPGSGQAAPTSRGSDRPLREELEDAYAEISATA
jgi:phage shock protein A